MHGIITCENTQECTQCASRNMIMVTHEGALYLAGRTSSLLIKPFTKPASNRIISFFIVIEAGQFIAMAIMKFYYSLFTSIITVPSVRCLSTLRPRARFTSSFSSTSIITGTSFSSVGPKLFGGLHTTSSTVPSSFPSSSSFQSIRCMSTSDTDETIVVDICREKIQSALGTEDVIVTGTSKMQT